MDGGQDVFFTETDGRLEPRAEQRHWLAAHRQKALRLLNPRSTDRLVDVGCGEGYLTLPLAARAGASVGIDFATSSLQALRRQPEHDARRLQLLVASVEHIPLSTGSVDRLICNHVLEHLLDDDAVVREMRRIVRPDGQVLIGVPLTLGPHVSLALRVRRIFFPSAREMQLERVQAGRLAVELVGRESHIRFYSLQSVYDLLERHGFQVLRAEGIALNLRGRPAALCRRNRLLFGLTTALGRLFPGIGAGVLVLARRLPD